MSDFETRSRQHNDRMNTLNAELRGLIEAACDNVKAGRWTAEQALTRIAEKQAATQAQIEASWNELLGGAS